MSTEKVEEIKLDLDRSRLWLQQHQTQLNLRKVVSSIELIFVHLPKTGGSLLNKVFSNIYGEEKILFAYADLPLGSILDSQHKVISGHCAGKYLDWKPYMANVNLLTSLRNPIIRVISNYYFILSTPSLWSIDNAENDIVQNQLNID